MVPAIARELYAENEPFQSNASTSRHHRVDRRPTSAALISNGLAEVSLGSDHLPGADCATQCDENCSRSREKIVEDFLQEDEKGNIECI